ncbi:hypothetical protein AgCh_029486 [Apium graveolens]
MPLFYFFTRNVDFDEVNLEELISQWTSKIAKKLGVDEEYVSLQIDEAEAVLKFLHPGVTYGEIKVCSGCGICKGFSKFIGKGLYDEPSHPQEHKFEGHGVLVLGVVAGPLLRRRAWILRRCKGVVVVGFLQNNTGRGVWVPRHLRRESKNSLLGKMKIYMNAGCCPHHVLGPVSHVLGFIKVWLAGLEGFVLFLPPSPDCAEFGKSGLRWFCLAGVELFSPPVRIDLFVVGRTEVVVLAGVEFFLPQVRIALSSANQD